MDKGLQGTAVSEESDLPADYTGVCVTQFFSVQNSSQTAFSSQGLTPAWDSPSLL